MLSKITLALAATELIESQNFNVFEIVVVGFSFVFIILLILSYTTSVLGKFFARIPVEKASSPVVAKTATALEKSPVSSDETGNDLYINESNPHLIAVIAAAIHCAVDGRRHRIVSIHASNTDWAAEGRRQIFSSHKVR
jgi:Na+-transporting methylmalonyl-CoA/oxaloacetate decarboxylase gamma subunit